MFRIRWSREAMDEVTAIHDQADEETQQAISAAIVAMAQRLRESPYQEGESRGGRRRVTFEPPLSLVFEVGADEATVSILRVRLYERRS